MKQVKNIVVEGMKIFTDTHNIFRKLQKHLHNQPVGFPATITGVELRILQEFFTVDEAEIALFMSYKFQTAETLHQKIKKKNLSQEKLQNMLDNMEKNGALFVNIVDGVKHYALAPFIVGMIDQKLPTINANLAMAARKYAYQSFGTEFLSTSHPQGRIIPIQKSVPPDMRIATYDEIREVILRCEGHICLSGCVCRVQKDKIGRHCLATDRREVCLQLGDFGDQYIRNGFGRAISSQEAFEVLAQNEKEGLVLQVSNCQKSIFACSCCKCCCGILELTSLLENPAEFVKSNFYVTLQADKCVGCGACAPQCITEAIVVAEKNAIGIDLKRCLGCGVCVASCKTGALSLTKKEKSYVPPEDLESLLEEINQGKKGTIGRLIHTGRKVIGI